MPAKAEEVCLYSWQPETLLMTMSGLITMTRSPRIFKERRKTLRLFICCRQQWYFEVD